MYRSVIYWVFLTQLLFTGCATFVNDDSQKIKVELYTKDKVAIKAATCVGSNDFGEVTADRNGILSIHRSSKDLLITCTKYGEEPGFGLLISRLTKAIYGNVLLGGAIGAALDHKGGAAYAYPAWVRIVLGESLTFDQNDSGKLSAPNIGATSKSSKQKKTLFDEPPVPKPTGTKQ